MLRRHVLTVTLPLMLLAWSCAPISVASHVAGDADFSRYHTFAWAVPDNLPTGDPRLDRNPFFQDYVQGAVERHLRGHGIALADTTARADLLVHYHGAVTQRVEVLPVHDGSSNMGQEPRVASYDESTLVLDLVDARTHRLVWRGWAQDNLQSVINNQDAMRAHIERSIERMLKRLPV